MEKKKKVIILINKVRKYNFKIKLKDKIVLIIIFFCRI